MDAKVRAVVDHCQPTNIIVAIISLILNIFIPGTGTILNGFMGPMIDFIEVGIGAIQLITAICIIGWVWSILWGIIFILRSKPLGGGGDKGDANKNNNNNNNSNNSNNKPNRDNDNNANKKPDDKQNKNPDNNANKKPDDKPNKNPNDRGGKKP
mmetsp:Transcript_37504/g.43109  ORF Transcript_37504/g.43109 Transcript_37504/m.43109 type:complete len:154 (-) Transcript_37504:69-530(-)